MLSQALALRCAAAHGAVLLSLLSAPVASRLHRAWSVWRLAAAAITLEAAAAMREV